MTRLPRGFDYDHEVTRGIVELKLSNLMTKAMQLQEEGVDEIAVMQLDQREVLVVAELLGMPPNVAEEFFGDA